MHPYFTNAFKKAFGVTPENVHTDAKQSNPLDPEAVTI
jgi:AraC-like DNA-binding protein